MRRPRPTELTKRRARTEEDREIRRAQILDAAEALFGGSAFASLPMTEVARVAGLAKGTLYLYFPTKEELFLAVLERRLAEWGDALAREVSRVRGKDRARALAEAVTRTLVVRVELTRLLALLHPVLAQNLGFETALGFERRLRAATSLLGVELERALPDLPVGEGSRLLLRVHAAVAGLRQMADPPPALAAGLDGDDENPFRIDFDTELEHVVEALVRHAARQRAGRA